MGSFVSVTSLQRIISVTLEFAQEEVNMESCLLYREMTETKAPLFF